MQGESVGPAKALEAFIRAGAVVGSRLGWIGIDLDDGRAAEDRAIAHRDRRKQGHGVGLLGGIGLVVEAAAHGAHGFAVEFFVEGQVFDGEGRFKLGFP
jgi:hypothetical protein